MVRFVRLDELVYFAGRLITIKITYLQREAFKKRKNNVPEPTCKGNIDKIDGSAIRL